MKGIAAKLSVKGLIAILALLIAALVSVLVPTLVSIKRSRDIAAAAWPSPFDQVVAEYADSLPDSPLPRRFVVERSFWVPPTNQQSRETGWGCSTIFLLQSQHHAQGVRRGCLRDREQVRLSVQAFVSAVGEFCRANRTAAVCPYGGFLNANATDDNEVEAFPRFVAAMPNLTQSIVPETVCPYFATPSSVTDFQCNGLSEALEANPIQFAIKSTTSVFDLRAAKQLLYKVRRPLAITVPLGDLVYHTKCPDGSSCGATRVPFQTSDGVFVSRGDVTKLREGSRHAMNLIGWNDNWRYHSRFALPSSVAELRGGLILHNSRGSSGHSVEFFTGARTLENEQTLCPNHASPLNWVPCARADLVAAGGNWSRCSTDIQHVRGRGRTLHADVLRCTDSIRCQVGRLYVMGRRGDDANTIELESGMHLTEFFDVVNLNSIDVVWPFWALGAIFEVADGFVANDEKHCGYFMFPYDTLEEVKRRSWDFFENFKASDIEVEFTDGSYARAQTASGNFGHLRNSTERLDETLFNGPIPFDLIYQ
jgi:hypothetical protein